MKVLGLCWGRNRFKITGFILGTLCCAAASLHAEPSTQELLERVRALEIEVHRLRADRETGNDRTPLVDAAVAEAAQATRTNHFTSDTGAITAGYFKDRGFVIRSAGDDFLLHPWLLLQFRNVTNYRQDAKQGGTESDFENGFEMRRLKVGIDGNLFSKDTTYQVIWSSNRKSGVVSVDDAWIRHQFAGTPFAIRAGQIRNPFDHEQIMYGVYSQTVERSLVDMLFADGEGVVQGVGLSFDSETVRTDIAFSDGMRSASTNFQDYPTNNTNWGVAARAEWKLLGDWRQYKDFTALGGDKPLVVAGGGIDYTETGSTDVLSHVVDVQFEVPSSGFACYAAYLGRYTSHNRQIGGATGTGESIDTYDTTLRLQAAYAINQSWEPYLRYEYIHFDGRELPATAGTATIHEFTAGVNYYIVKHNAKLSADILYLPNGSPISEDGSGVLIANHGQEIVLRAQLQIWR